MPTQVKKSITVSGKNGMELSRKTSAGKIFVEKDFCRLCDRVRIPSFIKNLFA